MISFVRAAVSSGPQNEYQKLIASDAGLFGGLLAM